MKNLMFDQNKEKQEGQQNWVIKKRYETLLKVLNLDLSKVSLPPKVIIYGAGNIGWQFYLQIKENCEVIAFCDKMRSTIKKSDLPVVGLEEIEWERKIPIIVTATYDFENIYHEIKQYDEGAVVISLEKLLSYT